MSEGLTWSYLLHRVSDEYEPLNPSRGNLLTRQLIVYSGPWETRTDHY